MSDAEDYYRYLLETQLPPTAGHRASMLQDILAGRKTEIEALNGAISRYAGELGISTPYNDLLTNLIKFKEKPENQGQGRSTGTGSALSVHLIRQKESFFIHQRLYLMELSTWMD